MKYLSFIFLSLLIFSCMKSKKVDLIVHNAKIYTVDKDFTIVEAMAIKDGKIVETGPEREILNKYRADEFIDLEKRVVFPGFIDAHAHFHGIALQFLSPDLSQTKSPKEAVKLLEDFYKDKEGWITARGWDQSLWGLEEMPDNTFINDAFPKRPVYITRIDGHAALINQKAIEVTELTPTDSIEGGTFVHRNGEFTGILVDLAMNKVKSSIPDASEEDWLQALEKAQQHLFQYGITTIADAGLLQDDLERIIQMNEDNSLKINLYGMLYANNENFDWAKEHGQFHEKNLTIRSFKVVADGAMGSNGACMLEHYSDLPKHGKMLLNKSEIEDIARLAKLWEYQLNVHCIGDSTNRAVLNVMASQLKEQNDLRWRIEHAQIIHSEDMSYFEKYSIIPSVQPSHLMSDYRWLKQKLGEDRLSRGYRYKTLKEANGVIAFGTDAPVESVNPFRTFYAAINRTMENGEPKGGFLPDEKMNRKESLRAMTNWASLSIFKENTLGTLSEGFQADFVVLDKNIIEISVDDILKTHVIQTFKKGKSVYNAF